MIGGFATREQAAPRPGQLDVTLLLVHELRASGAQALGVAATDALVEDLLARQALGRERYGTVLQTHNGRSALVDAYQEALDLTQYLAQAFMEGIDAVRPDLEGAIALCVRLRRLLGAVP